MTTISKINPCRPRKSLIYSSLCIATAFVLISTHVRVERAGHHLRIHFPAAFVTVFRATAGFLDHQLEREISL